MIYQQQVLDIYPTEKSLAYSERGCLAPNFENGFLMSWSKSLMVMLGNLSYVSFFVIFFYKISFTNILS